MICHTFVAQRQHSLENWWRQEAAGLPEQTQNRAVFHGVSGGSADFSTIGTIIVDNYKTKFCFSCGPVMVGR
jgi:hypothetical protein